MTSRAMRGFGAALGKIGEVGVLSAFRQMEDERKDAADMRKLDKQDQMETARIKLTDSLASARETALVNLRNDHEIAQLAAGHTNKLAEIDAAAKAEAGQNTPELVGQRERAKSKGETQGQIDALQDPNNERGVGILSQMKRRSSGASASGEDGYDLSAYSSGNDPETGEPIRKAKIYQGTGKNRRVVFQGTEQEAEDRLQQLLNGDDTQAGYQNTLGDLLRSGGGQSTEMPTASKKSIDYLLQNSDKDPSLKEIFKARYGYLPAGVR